MYKVAACFFLGLSFASVLVGQEPDRPLSAEERDEMIRRSAQAEMDRQELVNLENEAARAIKLNNPTFFRRVYSDDFAGTLSHGQPVNKTSFIEAIQTPDVKYVSFLASDVTIRTYQQTAIATCMWSFRATYKGKQVAGQMRTLHVYVNTPRGWRVVAGQATALPPEVEQPL